MLTLESTNIVSFATRAGLGCLCTLSLVAAEPNKLEKDPVVVLDNVVVTGVRASVERASEEKRNAQGIVDSVVAEDIGKFPDGNITEAMQRITGVQIRRTFGEGDQVSIRGLAPEFANTVINGLSAPSGENNREMNFELYASELFSKASIMKTSTADQLEGGISGSILLETRRPFDFRKRTLRLSGRLGYSDVAKSDDPKVFGLFADQWLDGRLGVLLTANYDSRLIRSDYSDSVQWELRDFDTNGDNVPDLLQKYLMRVPRSLVHLIDRERVGYTAAVDYRFSPAATLSFDFLETRAKTDFKRYSQEFLITGTLRPLNLTVEGDTIVAGSFADIRARSENTFYHEDKVARQGSAGFKYSAGDWKTNALFGYARTENLRPFSFVSVYGTAATTIGYDIRENPKFPVLTTPLVNRMNPASYTLDFNRYQASATKDTEGSARLDLERALGSRIGLEKIKFGVSFRDKEKDRDSFRTDTTLLRGRPFAPVAAQLPYNDFWDADENIPAGFVRTWLISDPKKVMDTYFENSIAPAEELLAGYLVDEKVSAGYAMVDFKHRIGAYIVGGNIGARYVTTSLSSRGYQTVNNVTSPITIKRDYDNILPSAIFRVSLTDQLLLRAGFAGVMARPRLEDLSSRRTINDLTHRISQGNPHLKPYEATNYDVAIEYYHAKDSMVYSSLFYKSVKSFISTESVSEVIDGFTYDVTKPINGKGGYVRGIEAGIQQQLSFLPGTLANLGVILNYTYVDSAVTFKRPTSLVTLPMPGLSPNSYNAIVYYDNKKLDARLAYNYRDTFVRDPFVTGGVSKLQAAYGTMDFSASYALTKHIRLRVEATNLLDESQFEFNDLPIHMDAYTHEGRRVFVGVDFKF